MKICGIYLITHTATGRKYVGQSVDIRHRFIEHATTKKRSRLGNAVRKYGWGAFETQIIELCEREHLNQAETKWITDHNCFAPKGFNLTTGGNQQFAFSAETRAKISASLKGRKPTQKSIAKRVATNTGTKRSAETKANMAALHGPVSTETKAKISLSNTGKIRTEEFKARISATRTGSKHTPEAKEKNRVASTGRKLTPESIAKMRATHLGKKRTPEAKAKMAAAKLGTKQTPETIAKRVASMCATKAAKRLLHLNTTIPLKNQTDWLAA